MEVKFDEYLKLLEEYKKMLNKELGVKMTKDDWGDGGMAAFAMYCVEHFKSL